MPNRWTDGNILLKNYIKYLCRIHHIKNLMYFFNVSAFLTNTFAILYTTGMTRQLRRPTPVAPPPLLTLSCPHCVPQNTDFRGGHEKRGSSASEDDEGRKERERGPAEDKSAPALMQARTWLGPTKGHCHYRVDNGREYTIRSLCNFLRFDLENNTGNARFGLLQQKVPKIDFNTNHQVTLSCSIQPPLSACKH